MNTTTIILMLLRGATVALGAFFLALTVRTYLRHRDTGILWLTAAIGLMILAAAAELVAFLILGAGLGAAEVMEATITMAAFMVLVWSVRKAP